MYHMKEHRTKFHNCAAILTDSIFSILETIIAVMSPSLAAVKRCLKISGFDPMTSALSTLRLFFLKIVVPLIPPPPWTMLGFGDKHLLRILSGAWTSTSFRVCGGQTRLRLFCKQKLQATCKLYSKNAMENGCVPKSFGQDCTNRDVKPTGSYEPMYSLKNQNCQRNSSQRLLINTPAGFSCYEITNYETRFQNS